VADDSVGGAAKDARIRLLGAGHRDPGARMDAELLARHALGWDRVTWLTRAQLAASPEFLHAYRGLVDRRARHEPIAYITGTREFYGREFLVSPAVLIPRPETEFLVDVVLQRLPVGRPARVVDACTGSGIVAVTVAAERPGLHLEATDISTTALDVARRNATLHGVGDRVTWLAGDLLLPTAGRFDVITANPPYVAQRDAPGLSPQVRDFEPSVALFGGTLGLDLVTRLLAQAAERLTPEGWLAMEFGDGQEERVVPAAIAAGFRVIQVVPDLQGIARVLVADLP